MNVPSSAQRQAAVIVALEARASAAARRWPGRRSSPAGRGPNSAPLASPARRSSALPTGQDGGAQRWAAAGLANSRAPGSSRAALSYEPQCGSLLSPSSISQTGRFGASGAPLRARPPAAISPCRRWLTITGARPKGKDAQCEFCLPCCVRWSWPARGSSNDGTREMDTGTSPSPAAPPA